MDTEFVTREKFAAMVAERDALARRLADVVQGNAAIAAERDRILTMCQEYAAERDALAARYDLCRQEIIGNDIRRFAAEEKRDRLTAQLAAAHGLQSRAEAAEAECLRLRAECARVAEVEGRRHD